MGICMTSLVKDAIIIAAGIGSRMLPASLYSPKEFLPLVDVPAIHHVISEAVKSEAERIHIVISEEKMSFVEKLIIKIGSLDSNSSMDFFPGEIQARLSENIELEIHVQKKQNGVGDAISCALGSIGGPCLVLLGDNLMMPSDSGGPSPGEGKWVASRASLELVKSYYRTGCAVAGISAVPDDSVSQYGVVEMDGEKIIGITEKPEISEAKTNLVLCGRYVFPPGLKEVLNRDHIKEMGEMQSIGALMEFSRGFGLNGHLLDDYKWYDFGTPINWLKAQLDHAKSREDMDIDF